MLFPGGFVKKIPFKFMERQINSFILNTYVAASTGLLAGNTDLPTKCP